MTINDSILGKCELEIEHGRLSCVDSYIGSGFSITLNRELTDEELNRLQSEYESEIQMNSWEGGHSLNHN